MMQGDLFDANIVKVAIKRLHTFEPPEGYYLAFSGGKDSIVLKHLADRAKVAYSTHYSVVPVDPPELRLFIKENYPDVSWERPRMGITKMMVSKGYPTRQHRFCCEVWKEAGGENRTVLVGIRWAESSNRTRSHMVSRHTRAKNKLMVAPIIDWTDQDIWSYIRDNQLAYCQLYDEGWKRLGCVGCPMVRDTKAMIRWPRVMKLWERALRAWFEKKPRPNWTSFEAFYLAWLDRDAPLGGDVKDDDCLLFAGTGTF